MDVLVVREVIKFVREYVLNNGFIFIEVVIYRYYGYSMSDLGIRYGCIFKGRMFE